MAQTVEDRTPVKGVAGSNTGQTSSDVGGIHDTLLRMQMNKSYVGHYNIRITIVVSDLSWYLVLNRFAFSKRDNINQHFSVPLTVNNPLLRSLNLN